MQKPRFFSAVWGSISGKRAFSSSSKASQKFYEYRTYTVKPKRFSKCEIYCVSFSSCFKNSVLSSTQVG